MDYVDIDYKYDNHLMPQRFSIAGDMIVPTFENLNSAKQAEYLDKVTNDKIGIGCLAGVAVLLSILLASKQEPLPEYHEQKETEPAVEQAPLEMYRSDNIDAVKTKWSRVFRKNLHKQALRA